MICGVLRQSEESRPDFLRDFELNFRAVPMFSFPRYAFTDKQIRSAAEVIARAQSAAVAALGISTHVVDFSRRSNRRYDLGTMMISSILSIFLICGVSVLVGLYIRKRISGRNFLLLFLCFLIPTTINETKERYS